ncbi:unnamed protein product [Merluccius merluccius]
MKYETPAILYRLFSLFSLSLARKVTRMAGEAGGSASNRAGPAPGWTSAALPVPARGTAIPLPSSLGICNTANRDEVKETGETDGGDEGES